MYMCIYGIFLYLCGFTCMCYQILYMQDHNIGSSMRLFFNTLKNLEGFFDIKHESTLNKFTIVNFFSTEKYLVL